MSEVLLKYKKKIMRKLVASALAEGFISAKAKTTNIIAN
jgi:hypothetical protein